MKKKYCLIEKFLQNNIVGIKKKNCLREFFYLL